MTRATREKPVAAIELGEVLCEESWVRPVSGSEKSRKY
jgi:hypothetical protein